MAVWLSMDMSYIGQGDYANSSKVIVSVNVHWDYKHFNRDGGTLKVTVDGVTDTKTVPFNAGETSSGSQNLYSYYWNVAQPNGAAKTVSASATFQATSNTAATPTSATLSLPAISGSGGGDSGGGDTGGGDDSGGGGTTSGGTTPGGNTSGGTTGGGNTNEGTPDTPSTNIEVHPDTNCTYLGTSHDNSTFGNNKMDGYDSFIRFKTPSDLITSNSVKIKFDSPGGFDLEYPDSGAEAVVYFSLYTGHLDILAQEIVHFSIDVEGRYDSSTYTVTLKTTEQSLEPDTEYTIKVLVGNDGTFEAQTPPAIIIDYVGAEKPVRPCYIANVPYVAYIGNGTTFDKYEVYIGNGTTFVPYG